MKENQSLVPYEVIKLAAQGDIEGMAYIIKHFDAYITCLSRKKLFDNYFGNSYNHTDSEMKRRLETKLIIAVLKFELGAGYI